MNTGTMAWWFFVVAFVFIGVVCVPLAVVWSVNALFGTGIPYSLKTWAAALILSGLFAANYSRR
jgi:hypothetical protein